MKVVPTVRLLVRFESWRGCRFFVGNQAKQDTPWKINMEPKIGGLKDDVPFQLRDF